MQDDYIIELIAKGLDEPLSASEQTQVNAAMQNSVAIRIAAEGLREFDALLKRTGMAVPDEGFPTRVLLRLDAYQAKRARAQWLFTLGMIFLGSLAAFVWVGLNGNAVIDFMVFITNDALVLLQVAFSVLLAVVSLVGQGPLLLYALFVLALTVVWARASGGFVNTTTSIQGTN